MSIRRLAFLFLGFALAVATGCSRFSRLQKSQDVDERYKGALYYFNKKDYYRAGMLLQDITPLLRGSARADTAQLYYSYCQFYEKQYDLAAFYFRTFVETYPRSAFAEEAAYMEGLSYYEDSPRYDLDQESTNKAVGVIQSFLTQYPESDRKEDCNFMIERLRSKLERKGYESAKLYLRKGNYQAAVIALENFRRDFPESINNEEAAALRVVAAYKLAQASIPSKQEERYTSVIATYETFLDRYPQSKQLPELGNYYETAPDLDSNQAWYKTYGTYLIHKVTLPKF